MSRKKYRAFFRKKKLDYLKNYIRFIFRKKKKKTFVIHV